MSAKLSQIQELLDLIIDTVSSEPHATKHLKMLSLVSKAWRTRSQGRMFKIFRLSLFKMKLIHSKISESANPVESRERLRDLFSYVQKLVITANGATSFDDHRQYLEILWLFTKVASLVISSWMFQEFESCHIKGFLQHFGESVKTLSLERCLFDSEVLIFLTSLFPHVNNLQVMLPLTSDNGTFKVQRDSQPLGVKFRGNLAFVLLGPQHNKFLAFINEHSSDLRSIHVQCCNDGGGELQNLFKCRGGMFLSVDIRVHDEKGKFVPISQHTCLQWSLQSGSQVSSPSHPAPNSEP